MNGWRLHYQLKWYALRAKQADIAVYYRSLLPLLTMRLCDAPLMALDLEMTGLNPMRDQILSIGLVPIERGQIPLGKAEQILVQIQGSVGQSATIHGIVDHQLSQAVDIDTAVAWFLKKSQGHILVAHHAPLDGRFLQRAISQSLQHNLYLPVIDTLAIEKRRLLRQSEVIEEGGLRLGACRERYALPLYSAHSALTDALACAELLLAQMAAMDSSNNLKVADVLRFTP